MGGGVPPRPVSERVHGATGRRVPRAGAQRRPTAGRGHSLTIGDPRRVTAQRTSAGPSPGCAAENAIGTRAVEIVGSRLTECSVSFTGTPDSHSCSVLALPSLLYPAHLETPHSFTLPPPSRGSCGAVFCFRGGGGSPSRRRTGSSPTTRRRAATRPRLCRHVFLLATRFVFAPIFV